MNKLSKSLIVLFLAFLLGSCFGIDFVQAQNNETNLKIIKECNIQYVGESCVVELKLINKTGKVLDGKASLHINYQGICSNNELVDFDGEGIEAQFSINSGDWLNFTGWKNRTTTVSGFNIAKGETQPKLKIKTVPNLCPGGYTFTLELRGTTEKEEYISPPVVIGYYTPPTTPITDTGKVTATPGEGGITTLTNPDGSKIKLIVPAGAISENTDFTVKAKDINSVNQPAPESGLFLIAGQVYEIKARAGTKSITVFNKPLTLIFTYTDDQIKGLDENSLKIYYWNGEEWVALENSEVDVDNNTVTVSIDHFTLFALLGSKIAVIEKEKPAEEIIPPEEEISPEEVVLVPPAEEIVPPEEVIPPEEEVVLPEELVITPPEERAPEEGLASLLLASIGMIRESGWMAIIATFCLIGLVVIGIRERELAGKKKKGIS